MCQRLRVLSSTQHDSYNKYPQLLRNSPHLTHVTFLDACFIDSQIAFCPMNIWS